jgi:hypothetical protein
MLILITVAYIIQNSLLIALAKTKMDVGLRRAKLSTPKIHWTGIWGYRAMDQGVGGWDRSDSRRLVAVRQDDLIRCCTVIATRSWSYFPSLILPQGGMG